MELNQIRALVTLAEQKHFGRAARLLHISQPALSKQVQLLEREAGAALFIRGRNGAQLTAFGALLMDDARAVLKASDHLDATCRQAATGDVGTLHLGFGFTALEIVPAAVAEFRRRHPKVEVRLADISTAEQIEALRTGKIQVGLVRLPVPSEFAQERLMEDRLALVMPREPRRRKPTLASIAQTPLVLLARDRAPGFYNHVVRLCGEHGFSPRVVQEANEFHTVLAFVAAGLGAGFVSESYVRARPVPPGIEAFPLADRSARWTVGVAWRKDEDHVLARQFVQILRAQNRRSSAILTQKTRVLTP